MLDKNVGFKIMKWIGMLHFNANYWTDYTIRIVYALSMDMKPKRPFATLKVTI